MTKLFLTVSEHSMVNGIAFMVSEIDDSTRKNLVSIKIPLVVFDGGLEGIKYGSVVIDQRFATMEMIYH